MAKITFRGSAGPDHPIYSGGLEIYSPRAFKPSLKSTAQSTTGATQGKSSSAPESWPTMDEVEAAIQRVDEYHHGTEKPIPGASSDHIQG